MRLLAVVSLVLLGACAPAVRSMMFVSPGPSPRGPEHKVRLYRDERPACPYEEIGLVRARRTHIFISMRQMEESLRARARRMGGDAVVGISERSELQSVAVSHLGVRIDSDPVYSGTVVRFTDPDCTY